MAALNHRKNLFEAQRQRELEESRPKDHIWENGKKVDKKTPVKPILLNVNKPKEEAKPDEAAKPGAVSAQVTHPDEKKMADKGESLPVDESAAKPSPFAALAAL